MSHLFKSKKEREREERRDRRKAFRQAENAVDDVKERQKGLEKEAGKQWQEARTALQAGEKEKARRLLTSYRANQVLITKLDQKIWVFQQYLTRMDVARSDEEFASALAKVNAVTRIDPERVADVFESSKDLLDEQVDADRFWSRLYEKESGATSSQLEDHIPSMDDLEHQLTEEAAIDGGSGPARAGESLDARVGEARERINKILGSESK